MTLVCEMTSVILAAVGTGRPDSRAISTDQPSPRVRSSRSSDSVCVVNGRACGTSRPSRIALRNPSRRSGVCPDHRICAIGQPARVQENCWSGGKARLSSTSFNAWSAIVVR